MNLKITGINIDITPAIREYFEKKLERTIHHIDGIISNSATLSVNKLQQKAEIDIHLSGKSIHAESIENDMYAAIDTLMDKLDRMLIKYKEKKSDHRATPSKRDPIE